MPGKKITITIDQDEYQKRLKAAHMAVCLADNNEREQRVLYNQMLELCPELEGKKMGANFEKLLNKKYEGTKYEIHLCNKYKWVTDIIFCDREKFAKWQESKGFRHHSITYEPNNLNFWESWQTKFSVHKEYGNYKNQVVFTKERFEHHNEGPYLTGASNRLKRSDGDIEQEYIEQYVEMALIKEYCEDIMCDQEPERKYYMRTVWDYEEKTGEALEV
jgi:hypothetical protein